MMPGAIAVADRTAALNGPPLAARLLGASRTNPGMRRPADLPADDPKDVSVERPRVRSRSRPRLGRFATGMPDTRGPAQLAGVGVGYETTSAPGPGGRGLRRSQFARLFAHLADACALPGARLPLQLRFGFEVSSASLCLVVRRQSYHAMI